MDNKKLLGRRIKELRKLSNLTQEQLAEKIELETSTLSGIESGRHFPSLPTIEKIANNLNIEMKVLFEFKHLQSKEEKKNIIIKHLDFLDDKYITVIYKLIEEFVG